MGQALKIFPLEFITNYIYNIFQVKASSFLGLNEKGEVLEGTGQAEISASTIHRGVHHVRPDAVCVFHVHPPYCTALGKTKFCSFN